MLPAIVIGAGPAGLATSRELSVRGVEHLVLERGDAAAPSWANVYDSLRLHTGKHLSALPGRPFPRSTPLFVSGRDFLTYLREYGSSFELPLRLGCDVVGVSRGERGWRVDTSQGAFEARAIVVATGIMSDPVTPQIPRRDEFAGTVLHSVDYRRPGPYVGRRVLVVGAGNSAGEIAPELADGGAHVTVSMRSGANVVPLTALGVPIQYVAWAVLQLPAAVRPAFVGAFARATRLVRGAPPFPPARGPLLGAVPIIGFKLVDAIRTGRVRLRGGIDSFTGTGVRLTEGGEEPFDDVIFATGFRAALRPVEELVSRDERGFALRRDRVVSAEQPDLFFVGHHYDATGGLHNIAKDAVAAARRIAAGLVHPGGRR